MGRLLHIIHLGRSHVITGAFKSGRGGQKSGDQMTEVWRDVRNQLTNADFKGGAGPWATKRGRL